MYTFEIKCNCHEMLLKIRNPSSYEVDYCVIKIKIKQTTYIIIKINLNLYLYVSIYLSLHIYILYEIQTSQAIIIHVVIAVLCHQDK